MVTITEKDREEAIRCYVRQCSKCAICTPPSFGHCGGMANANNVKARGKEHLSLPSK